MHVLGFVVGEGKDKKKKGNVGEKRQSRKLLLQNGTFNTHSVEQVAH